MDRKHLGILYPVFMIGMGIALTFVSAAFSTGLRLKPDPGAAAPYQAATPTPTPIAQAVSHPGSTDGIIWLGFVIVAIVLLPILLRRSIWTK